MNYRKWSCDVAPVLEKKRNKLQKMELWCCSCLRKKKAFEMNYRKWSCAVAPVLTRLSTGTQRRGSAQSWPRSNF
jgi:hypothetical protein